MPEAGHITPLNGLGNIGMPYPAWQRTRNILAYPHGWQQPAKTEEWAYERCLADLPENHLAQVLCFPWATLIDLQRKAKADEAKSYLDALRWTPPKTTLIRATVCQHIYAKDLLPWFKALKITDLFWPHALRDEAEVEGIRIHPFPLYPVCCANSGIASSGGKPLQARQYLYSFIGAYDPGLYLTSVRQWIFDLPRRADACVERRAAWHYEQKVYGEQIGGQPMTREDLAAYTQNSLHYAETMQDTVFSLCPSGSGPNSIRLWESIGFGCIPVILSDTLRRPGQESQWEKAAVIVEETEQAVRALPGQLEQLSRDPHLLGAMRQECAHLWARYGLESLPLPLDDLLAPIRPVSLHPEKRVYP